MNGTFINGSRQAFIPIRGTTTVHLGHVNGVALTITEDTPAPRPQAPSADESDDDDEITTLTEVTDPAVARAGAAVAARRKELDLAQRYLASSGRAPPPGPSSKRRWAGRRAASSRSATRTSSPTMSRPWS